MGLSLYGEWCLFSCFGEKMMVVVKESKCYDQSTGKRADRTGRRGLRGQHPQRLTLENTDHDHRYRLHCSLCGPQISDTSVAAFPRRNIC